ncbi:hypothetical protein SAMN02910278_02092 [Peptostreptococcus sp. D1]|nr:hypothetical protein SAMN02910278_02092 [Peptostreptococcus sp. D1]
MAEWEYGGVYKKYNLIEDEIYKINNIGKVMVHDITKGLPEFMKEADVLFVDPPWNKSNLNTFYTKADKDYRLESFKFFYEHLFNSIKQIKPKICFIEIGKENLHNFIIEMKKIYKYVTFYNSTYYHKKDRLCYIVQGSNKRINYHLDGMDEEDIITWICKNIDYKCIGDLCMGRGLVGYHSYINNKKFVGTELNHKRLAVLIDKVEIEEK